MKRQLHARTGKGWKGMLLLLSLLLSVAGTALAQTAASYTFTRSSGTFSSIQSQPGVVTDFAISCDDCTESSIPIGFNFTFCGNTSSLLAVSSNGEMSLANDGSICSLYGASGCVGAGKLFPYWRDDWGFTGGVCYYLTTGTPGSRVFTFEWSSWDAYPGFGFGWNFQVKLYESNNSIQFCYGPQAGGGFADGTIGIGNSTSDFQTLPNEFSTSASTSFFTSCNMPADGTVLTWTVPCLPGSTMPAIVAVTGGGGYCSGGAGVNVGLAGSAVGINYQLYLGGVPVGAPVAGIGAALSFGLQTTAGTYTATATNPSTGCTSSMSGSANVTIYPLPNVHSVTGGGSLCAGGTGVSVGVNPTDIGTNYQLFRGGLPVVGTITAGTGGPISFGLQTTAGVYTVMAKMAGFTGCTQLMSGSATVVVNPLPNVYSMTGGGTYCVGGTGVSVGLSNSDGGINYQLYMGSTPIGSPVAGTGAALTFGIFTAAGTYTVVATDATTGCVRNMTGTATVGINPLPTVFTVTGGGGYCAGGAGAYVGLSNSTYGVSYQLYLGGSPLGAPVAGVGGAISFGAQPAAGVYTVVATNTTTGCVNNMAGSATVTVNANPNVYTVTGGGSYCAGSSPGLTIGLSSSDAGVNYQLYRGTMAIGGPMGGTGGAITFGTSFTIAGTYTVYAYNPTTGCTANMSGSATISVLARPTVIPMTGGGGYCTGGSGVNIGLAGSGTGISYQLYLGASAVGSPVMGTGAALSFGLQMTPGVYTATATDLSTGCVSTMSGTATVYIYSLPTAFTVTGGGSYCAGGTGVTVGLSGSSSGVNYQLYRGGLPVVGTITAGTGSPISFGLQTVAGTYTVLATMAGFTGCTNSMTGSVSVSIDPLPTAYAVTGGGGYCAGGTGVSINLAGSDAGVNYQLYRGTTPIGSPVAGTGTIITFGMFTTAGTYTVKATNATTGCTQFMPGSATVTINSLPYALTVTGGGGYCTGGTGVLIGLAGSVFGTSYQLYLGATPMGSPVSGTGAGISFGLQTTAGIYTVIGTNTTTGCSNTMSGSATVTINTPPTTFTMAGGGGYCAGGTGVHVYLAGSSTGVMYQLYRGTAGVGAPMAGTGSALDFGLHTIAGTYTVIATASGSLCSATMSGSAVVSVNPLPTIYAVTGGGAYCIGGSGVSVDLANSDAGINYQLMRGTTPVGGPVAGTGTSITFGLQTVSGSYTVVATDATTGCVRNMSGSATVSIIALPTTYTVTGGGSFCSGGSGMPVYLSGSQAGVNYQLMRGTTAVGTPMAGTGAALSFGLQTVAGTYTVVATTATGGCTNTMAGSATIVVNTAPAAYAITGGGSYCSGGIGVPVGLSMSDAGVSYQLYRGSTPVGSPVAGSGAAISFGNQTVSGTYMVIGTSSGCSTTMTGTAVVAVGTLPAVVSVTGGGGYCSGGSGVNVGLSGSQAGVNYQLYRGGTPVGSPVIGTGMALSLGLQTVAGTYTVVGSYSGGTACSSNMAGSATVYVYATPTVYNVTGGGAYCSGGTGVHIYLSGSNSGISYKLYRGGTPVGSPVSGTGTAIDFGLYTTAGTYTVIATASGTGCVATMSGTDTVTINPLPTITGSIYTVAPSATITLTGSPSGGSFTSSNTAIATIGTTSGVVTGISLGTVVISYTLSTGCASGHTVAVTPTGHRSSEENTVTATSGSTDLFVMPNPNNGTFTLKGSLAEAKDAEVTIQVTDMLGRKIFSNTAMATNGQVNEMINLGNIARGTYLLSIHNGEDLKTFHVVVE